MKVEFICYECGHKITENAHCSWECSENGINTSHRTYQLYVEEDILCRESVEYFAPVINGNLVEAMEQIVEMRKHVRDSGK